MLPRQFAPRGDATKTRGDVPKTRGVVASSRPKFVRSHTVIGLTSQKPAVKESMEKERDQLRLASQQYSSQRNIHTPTQSTRTLTTTAAAATSTTTTPTGIQSTRTASATPTGVHFVRTPTTTTTTTTTPTRPHSARTAAVTPAGVESARTPTATPMFIAQSEASPTDIQSLPPDAKAVVEEFRDIDRRFQNLTDEQVVAGKGLTLNNDLKAIKTRLLLIRDRHPELLRPIVQRFNLLTIDVPAKVNECYLRTNNSRGADSSPNKSCGGSSPNCNKCGQLLSGQTVEAVGGQFHKDCFACADCGAKLCQTCLNIDSKPFCDRCGKRAFIRWRLGLLKQK